MRTRRKDKITWLEPGYLRGAATIRAAAMSPEIMEATPDERDARIDAEMASMASMMGDESTAGIIYLDRSTPRVKVAGYALFLVDDHKSARARKAVYLTEVASGPDYGISVDTALVCWIHRSYRVLQDHHFFAVVDEYDTDLQILMRDAVGAKGYTPKTVDSILPDRRSRRRIRALMAPTIPLYLFVDLAPPVTSAAGSAVPCKME